MGHPGYIDLGSVGRAEPRQLHLAAVRVRLARSRINSPYSLSEWVQRRALRALRRDQQHTRRSAGQGGRLPPAARPPERYQYPCSSEQFTKSAHGTPRTGRSIDVQSAARRLSLLVSPPDRPGFPPAPAIPSRARRRRTGYFSDLAISSARAFEDTPSAGASPRFRASTAAWGPAVRSERLKRPPSAPTSQKLRRCGFGNHSAGSPKLLVTVRRSHCGGSRTVLVKRCPAVPVTRRSGPCARARSSTGSSAAVLAARASPSRVRHPEGVGHEGLEPGPPSGLSQGSARARGQPGTGPRRGHRRRVVAHLDPAEAEPVDDRRPHRGREHQDRQHLRTGPRRGPAGGPSPSGAPRQPLAGPRSPGRRRTGSLRRPEGAGVPPSRVCPPVPGSTIDSSPSAPPDRPATARAPPARPAAGRRPHGLAGPLAAGLRAASVPIRLTHARHPFPRLPRFEGGQQRPSLRRARLSGDFTVPRGQPGPGPSPVRPSPGDSGT